MAQGRAIKKLILKAIVIGSLNEHYQTQQEKNPRLGQLLHQTSEIIQNIFGEETDFYGAANLEKINQLKAIFIVYVSTPYAYTPEQQKLALTGIEEIIKIILNPVITLEEIATQLHDLISEIDKDPQNYAYRLGNEFNSNIVYVERLLTQPDAADELKLRLEEIQETIAQQVIKKEVTTFKLTDALLNAISCPISLSPMYEPSIINSGYSFESHTTSTFNSRCPITRKAITKIRPNHNLQGLISAMGWAAYQNSGVVVKVKISSFIKCKYTRNIMVDPVVDFDGYSYEREAIVKYYQEHGQQYLISALIPNRALKDAIDAIQASLQLQAPTTAAAETRPAEQTGGGSASASSGQSPGPTLPDSARSSATTTSSETAPSTRPTEAAVCTEEVRAALVTPMADQHLQHPTAPRAAAPKSLWDHLFRRG